MKKKSLLNLYSVHPGVKMIQDWVEKLPKKTGRSLEEWVKILKEEGPTDAKQQRTWLKENYQLGTNESWWIADYAYGKSPWEGDPESYLIAAEQYVDNMFSGSKKALRPIYEALLQTALQIGPDVKACPCKTIVPLYRNHVFAQIKPSTKTRIDLGFALKDSPFTKKLVDTGGRAKKNRITHSMAITQLSDIDEEVIYWLKQAYQMD